jgi:hypothetical protein
MYIAPVVLWFTLNFQSLLALWLHHHKTVEYERCTLTPWNYWIFMKFWLDQNPGSIGYSWSSDWTKTLDLLDIHEVLIGSKPWIYWIFMKFWLDQNPGSIGYSWSSDWIKTLYLLDIHEVLIGSKPWIYWIFMKFWLDQNPGSIGYSWSSDWMFFEHEYN